MARMEQELERKLELTQRFVDGGLSWQTARQLVEMATIGTFTYSNVHEFLRCRDMRYSPFNVVRG